MWATDDSYKDIFVDATGCHSWYWDNGCKPYIHYSNRDDGSYYSDWVAPTEEYETHKYRYHIPSDARKFELTRSNGSYTSGSTAFTWINSTDANSDCCYKYHNFFKLTGENTLDTKGTYDMPSGGYVYLYANNFISTSNLSFMIGRYDHTSVNALTLLSNTEKLYYISPSAYTGFSYWSFVSTSSSWGSSSWGVDNITGSATDYTAIKYGYKFTNGQTYYVTKTSSSKGGAMSVEYKSSGYSAIPTYTTTLNIKVREATGGAYSNGSTSDKPAATIKITGTYMSGNGSTNRSDAEWSSSSSCSYQTVISGKVTPEYVTLDDNWQFDGWYIDDVSQGSGTSFDFYQYSDKTVEARFTRTKYDINLNNHGAASAGTTKVLATYGANTNLTSNITVPTKTGYTFGGYYTEEDGAGTQIINASGAWQTDNSLIDEDGKWNNIGHVTLHAKWTANTHTLTFHLNGGDSWGELGNATNTSGTVTLEVAYDQVLNGLTLPHAIKNAYHFDRWSVSDEYGYQHIWRYDYSVEPRIYHWYEYSGYVTKVGDNYIWKKDADVDLYAYYDAPELHNLSFSPRYVVPEGDVTATVTFSSVMGEPEGTYVLRYKLMTAAGTALRVQPEWKDKDDAAHTVSFTAPASPGEYTIGIKLFPGSSATWDDTGQSYYFDGDVEKEVAAGKFEVEEMNAVTVSYKSGSVDVLSSTTAYATWSNPATITAPDIPGLKFDNWSFTGSAYLKSGYAATDKTVEVCATGTGTATANYSQGSLFFKNTLNWDHVYVYFYNSTSYWTTSTGNSEGTGSQKSNENFISGPHEMTLLEGTDDVYYYAGEDGVPAEMRAVAFSKEKMGDWESPSSPGYEYFAGPTAKTDPCHVVYVNAFDANKPMIVPLGGGALWNKDYARYYAHDLAPLLPDWGYDLRGDNDIIGWSPETDADKHKMKAAKLGDLSFSTDIYFDNVYASKAWKIYNGNKGYGRSDGQTLTYTSQTSNPLANHDDSRWNLNVQTNIAGNYTFTLNFGTDCTEDTYSGAKVSDANGLMGHMTVKVTYPVDPGDFRLVYIGGAKPHPGNVIKKRANGEDIVSMYVAAGQSGSLKVQPCSAASASSVTWTGLGSCSAPTYADGINFASILSEGGAGTYNFTITQDENKVAKITNVEKYTGRFYVRTNCVDDKWNYKLSPDKHAMTYSEWSEKKMEDADMRFSHYYVDDLHGTSGSPINIRFTVATDYSDAICDTVFEGDADGKWKDYIHSESLQRTANVRFTYDQNRNKIWRAYTEGPENNDYMVLRSNGTDVFAVDGEGDKGDASAAVKFTDLNNWVYQADVFANVNTYIKLTADIAGVRQYLRGNTSDSDFDEDDAEMLIGGSGSGLSAQHMRITYDFKTDRMTTSWIPSSAVSGTLDIHADIMLLRTHQDGASSITFNTGGKLTDVKTAYGVMEFQKNYINDYSLSRYERNLYWISFPFDVNLSDVFGFGNYGEHWIIEYYDGKGRAEKGYWAESEPNWKFVTEEVKDEFVLKANEGYILALALSNMTEYSDIWANSVTSVYLYFPSANEIGNLSNVSSVTVEMDTVGYKCKITRDNRNIKDSYWRCIGVPSYAQSTRTDLPTRAPADWETKVPYVYIWNSINNSLAITSNVEVNFKAMHSYLIQYPDDKMVWEDVTNVPAGVMRRRVEGNNASFYEWNLNLLRNGEHQDHTYVRLSNDENVTDGYDFGNDLSKEFNSGSNIYTFVDDVEVAGNVKPIRTETTIVPVGVKIATTGEYTFSMPEGTNGVGVILVDNIAGTRTNLALEDYTVNLTQGNIDGRFLLEISPIAQTTTDMENVQGDDVQTNVRKVMVDGILYIVKDGKVFDARGSRLQ